MGNYTKEQIQNIKIGYGITLLVLFVISILAVQVIKEVSKTPEFHYAFFNDKGNLQVDDPVMNMGVPLGKVESIWRKGEKTLVEYSTEEPLEFFNDYSIYIKSIGLMGTYCLSINPGKGEKRIPPGDTLHGRFLKGIEYYLEKAWQLDSILDEYQDKLRMLTVSEGSKPSFVDQFNNGFNYIDTLTNILDSTVITISPLVGTKLENIETALQNGKKNMDGIASLTPEAIDRTHEAVQGINTFIRETDSLLTAIEGIKDSVTTLQDDEKERLDLVTERLKSIRSSSKKVLNGKFPLKIIYTRWKE